MASDEGESLLGNDLAVENTMLRDKLAAATAELERLRGCVATANAMNATTYEAGQKEIERLRAALASAQTASRIAETQRQMAVIERDECRRLLREACEAWEQQPVDTSQAWYEAARAAGGEE